MENGGRGEGEELLAGGGVTDGEAGDERGEGLTLTGDAGGEGGMARRQGHAGERLHGVAVAPGVVIFDKGFHGLGIREVGKLGEDHFGVSKQFHTFKYRICAKAVK